MKIINQWLIILVAAFFDSTLNGIMGRWVAETTAFLCVYHISFFSPPMLTFTAAFFVVMHAVLYNVTTPFLYTTLTVMLWSAGYCNKLLREDRWVRWLVTAIYFLLLVLFLPCTW